VGLGFLAQITGINAILYYSPTIIQEIVAFLVVDRWGRRPTPLTGIGTMGVANAILVLAYALNSPATFTLIGILLFTVGFNFGLRSGELPRAAARAGRLGDFRDLLRPDAGLVSLRLHTRTRDKRTATGGD